MEIIDLPDRNQRKKRIDEVRMLAKYIGRIMEPEMEEMFHMIFMDGEFWAMLEYELAHFSNNEGKPSTKRKPTGKVNDGLDII